jgi:hypothetical protein
MLIQQSGKSGRNPDRRKTSVLQSYFVTNQHPPSLRTQAFFAMRAETVTLFSASAGRQWNGDLNGDFI